MGKSTDIKEHPSTFAVMRSNDSDEVANIEYFVKEDEAVRCFEESDRVYDNVHLYRLLRCSETIGNQSPHPNL